MKHYTLGIDLGSSSIGWAMLNDEPAEGKTNILAGVRVFPEGVDRDTRGFEKSRNEQRRQARGMRRQHQRKNQRKDSLRRALELAGLSGWSDEDPYELRRRGLDHGLTPAQFGRALYHLNQRRGFKSNRKAEARKETGPVYEGISLLSKAMAEDGARTLGEFLARRRGIERLRNRYLLRDMLVREFELLWEKQSHFLPGLTEETRESLKKVIFFQRPLKPANLAHCELEPDEERCARASWFAQKFRILQEVANFRLLDRQGNECPLSENQRITLVQHLSARKKLEIEKVRELLGLEDSVHLNVESYKDKIDGNGAEAGLRRLFKKDFDKRPQFYVETVYESLVDLEEEEFERKAKDEWSLSPEQVEALYNLLASQPKGYSRLSRKAILNLLPHMQAGCDFFKAKEKAGYEQAPTGEALPKLPLPDESLPNPIVRKALHELRRVVNAIVREHGKPEKIVVELARDTKGTARERKENLQRNMERNREREEIEERLRGMGLADPRSNDVLKYRLWEECGQICPFSGRAISFEALFRTGEVQVEHILPYSRSLDDSQMNKTLCFVSENQWKANRTPWEAYGVPSPARYEEMLERLERSRMPRNKKKRFMQRELDLDACVTRQLNDTRYMSREARTYLQRLGVTVNTTRGDVTAELRRRLGLNTLLGDDGEKNRADHRHHAVDAAVIALTGPKHLKNLARRSEFRQEGRAFPLPWTSFRADMEKVVGEMLVSHRVTRRIYGELHKETAYGCRVSDRPGTFVYRKPLAALTAAAIEQIRDFRIRELVKERLALCGGDFKKAFGDKDNPLLLPNRKGLKIPIRSVRISTVATNMIPINDASGKPYRYVAPRSNHHVSIFEYKDASGRLKRDAVVTTMYEAARIAAENGRRRKEGGKELPLIRRVHPEQPDARFLFSLSKNEMVLLGPPDGNLELFRVQTLSATEGDSSSAIDIRFRLHTAATLDDPESMRRIRSLSPERLSIRKVTIDPLGRLAEAHD